MTGPTHIAIALSCGIVAGAGKPALALLAGGAILPDLDHPQSFIGRVFFPISLPLNRLCGHRGAFHSFWLWGALLLLGYFLCMPLAIISTGALLHCLVDCATVSGVRAFAPWSEKLFVIFRRSWRIKSGSPSEIAVLAVFGMIAWGGGYMGAVGGISAMIGQLTGSPKIMFEEYQTKGLTKCRVTGKLRWSSGKIEEGEWLIIGSERQTGLALQGNERKIIHIPKDGVFLRARLKPQKDSWQMAKISGWTVTDSPVFFLTDQKWHYASAGDFVWGQVLGDNLKLIIDQK
ncbi:metal-dependent hydrolase [Desulfoprunum benzoelyticum]|uniref:Inner membrane protein n=1 Tax=Desulfoprunum benzoelyticum TaxID=1506996 RepID=A0A840V447_9BACT|nr:metal-dependent hydrolase [Desulfoprunum benzoelyticum]MBB5349568.1 inner membrane protein [Desulfoprunum benzoelyticum]MBM9531321.1 metal-dependent hydrolase [Desulfoprunum benzoelyticum]